MRSVPEPSSVGGSPATARDPWAGFGAGQGTPGPRYTNGGPEPDGDRAVADLARRLQDRVDGQEALLERVVDLVAQPDDRARIAELRDVTRRLRRDSEALLLLCGADPGVHRGAPHTLPAVLGDAVALVDEPSRVALRPVPPVTLTSSAAVELRHVVAELVDEAVAASPGARIEVGGRLESDGALVVEVVVAGRGWTDALGTTRRTPFGGPRLAERLTRRSTGGIRLERPSIDAVAGLVATVHCPSVLVTGHAGGDPWSSGSLPVTHPPVTYPPVARPPVARPPVARPPAAHPIGTPPAVGSLVGAADTAMLFPSSAAPSRAGGDELFGPLPSAAGAVGTPIFEAVASAWFRDDERGPAANDWASPGDREWRAAEAAATRTDVPSTTASGLPRRSPGDRLVPPPRDARQAVSDERVPERVRDRLATYQRGLQQGRHRATEPAAEAAPEAWTADGW